MHCPGVTSGEDREEETHRSVKPCWCVTLLSWGFPAGSDGKETAGNAEDTGSVPGSGRSHGEGNGYPLQYSCLENSMDRGT